MINQPTNPTTQEAGITLLGLGPGGSAYLTGEAREWLLRSRQIYARTTAHPVLQGSFDELAVYSFDAVFEYGATQEAIDEQIVNVLLELGSQPGGVTYAVPGHPLWGEATCAAIWRAAIERGIPVRVIAGLSWVELACAQLGGDACEKLTLMDALSFRGYQFPPFSPALPVLIGQLGGSESLRALEQVLLTIYPADHPVTLLHPAALSGGDVETLSLAQAHTSPRVGKLSALYLPAISADASFEALQEVIARLRAPDGCPWDREQTHQSLRSSLLEETYEALAALDADDPQMMTEELGDLLMQVVMHAQIGAELGEFSMVDIVQGIHRKLVRRHPHVFADVNVEDTENVLVNWEKIKEKERGEKGVKLSKGMLDGVPRDYPALSQAQEYQKRARRVGFDWLDVSGVLDKVREEFEELQDASTAPERAAELGDLLFSVVNLARWCEVDAESALRQTNQKFKRRFQYVEQRAAESGQNLSDMTLEQMDVFWDEAKNRE